MENIKEIEESIAGMQSALDAAIETGDAETEKLMREYLDEAKNDLKKAKEELASASNEEEPKKSTAGKNKTGRPAKPKTETKPKSTEKTVEKEPAEVKKEPSKTVKIVGKTVVFKGKEYPANSKELCDVMIAAFNERREKAKKQAKKSKTKSVFEKAADKVESTIVSAVKETFQDNKDKIMKQPDQYFAKVKKVQAAGEDFLESFKELVGSEFDRKEINSFTKTITDAVNGLKKEIEKVLKEKESK